MSMIRILRGRPFGRHPRRHPNSASARAIGRRISSLELLEHRLVLDARLAIFVDGAAVTIPQGVGFDVSGSPLSQVRTLSSSGVLTVAPIASEPLAAVTLEDFFQTWRTNSPSAGNNADAVFDQTQLLDNLVDNTHFVQMFVNGQPSTEFERYVLQANDEIVLAYSADPLVALRTNFGPLVFELLPTTAPNTVENFLNYVNRGDYTDAIFHRSAQKGNGDKFVIQAGGFTTSSPTFTNVSQFTNIPTDPPVANEFGRSNVRGTVAMAKLGTGPDTATSQFFVNLSDNSSELDGQNGGFTVFALALDMITADEIAALPVNRANASPFNELPVSNANQLAVIQAVEGLGTVRGRKYFDANGNGVFDSSDTGVANAVVFVDGNGNGVLDPDEQSVRTNSDGTYAMQVPAGNRTVRSIATSGRITTVPNALGSRALVLEIGREQEGIDFAEIADARFEPDSYTVDEDTTLTVAAAEGVLANDDATGFTAIVDTPPTSGQITLQDGGGFTYIPNANFAGSDSFTYVARNSTEQSGAVLVQLTVTSQPDPPTANNDTFLVTGDDSLDVLANDSAAPDANDTLTIDSIGVSSAGSSLSISDNKINYTPPTGFLGTDTFDYTIRDSDGLTDTATVSVTVGVTPTARLAGMVFIDANNNQLQDDSESPVPGVQISLSGTDSRGESVLRTAITLDDGTYEFDQLSAGTYRLIETQPQSLSDGLAMSSAADAIIAANEVSNIVLADGQSILDNNFGEQELYPDYLTIAWFFASSTPTASFFREIVAIGEELAGNGDLASAIRQGGDTALPTVPVAGSDHYEANASATLTIAAGQGVLANDVAAAGESLTAALVTTTSHGTLTLQPDGGFTYVPESDFSGTDTFTYRASDGANQSNVTTVTLVVMPAANEPPVPADDAYSVSEDSTLTVNAATGVLANDTDADGDSLTVTLVTDTTEGQLQLAADGSFTYTPAANFTGTDSFAYRVSDSSSTSAVATAVITVNPVNDAPVGAADSYDAIEDQTLEVPVTEGVLVNDTDVDNSDLTAQIVSSPTNGTLTFRTDGSFTYLPNTNFHGTDSFSYHANDGTVTSETTTVTLLVGPTNDAPTADADDYAVSEDGTLTVTAAEGVLANDTDVDGDPLTALLVAGPANGTVSLGGDGSFVYTPDDNFNGTDSFTYTANDSSAASAPATVQVVVAAVNDPPVASPDSYGVEKNSILSVALTASVLLNDTDPESDPLTARFVSNPSHGSVVLNSDGSFTYTPNDDFTGTDSFTYAANDGVDLSPPATVTISVVSQNSLPVASADSYATDEDQPLSVAVAQGVLVNDTDADDNPLIATLTAQPVNGTVELQPDGSFVFTPRENVNGQATFQYTVSDGIGSSPPTLVTITIRPVDDLPVAEGDLYPVTEDQSLVVPAEDGVIRNDSDPDGDPLTVRLGRDATSGVLVLNVDGSFNYTPAADFVGGDAFTYFLSDGNSESAETFVLLSVEAVNDAPVGAADSYGGYVGIPLGVPAASGVLVNDSDVDNGAGELTAELVAPTSHGTLDLQADGSFSYQGAAEFQGADSFTYRVSDGQSFSDPITVTLAIAPLPDPVTATVAPAADAVLYESAQGELANGAGAYLFVGKTGQDQDSLRRSLLRFDVAAANIPAGALVTGASLTMNLSKVTPYNARVTTDQITLHKVTSAWSEGTADAGGEEGAGTVASTGDVTWLHSSFDASRWNSPGGDFLAQASASSAVTEELGSYVWSSAQMAADVQAWLDDPSGNFGWLMLGDEAEPSAKRFDSREQETAGNRPTLQIQYVVLEGVDSSSIPVSPQSLLSAAEVDAVFAE